MTERIREFLRTRQAEGRDSEPCLVVDLEVVRENYNTFANALPDARVFYAIKANPAPEVLSLLASLGYIVVSRTRLNVMLRRIPSVVDHRAGRDL